MTGADDARLSDWLQHGSLQHLVALGWHAHFSFQESCRPQQHHVGAGGPELVFHWRVETVFQSGFDPGPMNPVRRHDYSTAAR